MKVTIKKIAEVAQVSRGTVDRALNHRPGVNVEVAARIQKIAQELGYEPDLAARTLASKRYTSRKIGVLLCAEGNPFFWNVIQGVNNALEELSHFGVESVVKSIKGFDAKRQIEAIDELLQEGINGLVLTPVNAREVAAKLRSLIKQGIEVVNVNTDVISVNRLAYVGCDYVTSGCVAGELMGMMSNGLKEEIVVVIGSELVLAQAQRIKGIRDTLKADFPNVTVRAVLENEEDDQRSYEVVRRFLENNKHITGICFGAAGVEGGIRALRDLGLEKKVRVVTYDLTDIVQYNLKEGIVSATICQEPFRQGYLGVDILGKYLLSGKRPEKTVINTHVFIATKYNL